MFADTFLGKNTAAEYLLTRVSLHWAFCSPLVLALVSEKLDFRLSIIKNRLEVFYKQGSKYAFTAQLSLNIAQLLNHAAMQFTGPTTY